MARSTTINRLWDLLRGITTGKVGWLERRNPAAVYERAIQRSLEQHDRLRDAVARLVYLQRRVDTRLADKRLDLKVVEAALAQAVQHNNDETALTLLEQKQRLLDAISDAELKHRALSEQVAAARANLEKLGQALVQLREERSEMLSRHAHAQVRIETGTRLRELTLDSPAFDAALDNVRESILQSEALADLTEGDGAAEKPDLMGQLRGAARRQAGIEALAALRQRPQNAA